MALEAVEANSIAEDAQSDDAQSVGSASSGEAVMEHGTTNGPEDQWDDQWNLGWSGHPRHMRPINAWTWQEWHSWSGKQPGVETKGSGSSSGEPVNPASFDQPHSQEADAIDGTGKEAGRRQQGKAKVVDWRQQGETQTQVDEWSQKQ